MWKILIIDDDEDDFLITREMLKEAKGRKFDIQWANTYAAGQEALITNSYNAVLVDYDLGIRSGIDLIRETSERGYAAPLILFTGRGNYEVDVEAMEAGATLYLTKGEVNPLLLERAIRYAIEMKQKEHALREREANLRNSEAKERAKVAELNAIMDAVPAIVWITHDPEAKAVTGNQAAHDFLRVPVGKNLSKSDPEDAPRNFQVYQDGRMLAPEELPLQITAATGRPIRNFEEEVVFEDGDRAYLLGNVSPLLDEDGKPCGAVGAFINITSRKQSEQALKKAEEKFAKAFHSSPAALAITRSSDGRYVEANESLCQVTGYRQDEIIGRTALELGIYANPEQRAELIHLIKQQGTVRNQEVQVRSKSGVIRTISGSYDQIGLDNEAFLLATLIDITDRKQAEAALKAYSDALEESQARLIEFVESTNNNYIALDHEWRFTYANRHFGQLMGVESQALIGKNYWEVFPHYLGTALEQNYRKVMNEKVPMHYTQGGIYTKNMYEVSLYPTQEGIAIFSIDRSELLRQHVQLENEHARLDAVLHAMPVAVWIADQDGRLVFKNKQVDLIWGGDAPLSESIEAYQEYNAWFMDSGKPVAAHEFPVAQALKTGQPAHSTELRIRRFDGTEGAVLAIGAPIKDREGRLVGAVSINVDITERMEVEESLHQAHQKAIWMARFPDENPNPVARVAADGLVLYCNATSAALPGWKLVVNQPLTGLMMELVDRAITQVLEVREDIMVAGRSYSVSIMPIPEENYANIYGTDITARKQIEQALRLSEERFSRAFNANPSAMMISRINDGQIEDINASFERLFGYPRDRVVGKTIQELNLNTRPFDWEAMLQLIKMNGFIRDLELDLNTQSGEIRSFNVSVELLETGGKIALLSVLQDITERKRALESLHHQSKALRESEDRFRRAVMSAPYPIMIRRNDGQVIMINETWTDITGYTIQDIPTIAEWTKRAYGENAAQIQSMIESEEYSQSNRKGWGEFEVTTRSGERRIWDFQSADLGKDQEGLSLVLVGAVDVTERNRTEAAMQDYAEKLKRSNQELEQFAFVASHDLQEPLRKIMMFGDSLQRHLCNTPDEVAEDYIERMQSAAHRMQAMVSGLLDLSRVNTRGREFAPVQLNHVVEVVLSDLEPRIKTVNGQVIVEQLPIVEGDEVQLHELFQNLIGNALKFHKPDVAPVVRVTGTRKRIANSRFVEIRIEDNGLGFDQEYAGRIFEPFQRLHGRSEYEGTGLGLAICKKIVERHRGEIEAQSVPGQGTVFIVRLMKAPLD